MGMLDIPKAVYKAQQTKKKMSKIQAAGRNGAVSMLVNGLNDIDEVEINVEVLAGMFPDMPESELQKLAEELANSIKKAFADAKKQIEKKLVESTNMDDLRDLLSN